MILLDYVFNEAAVIAFCACIFGLLIFLSVGRLEMKDKIKDLKGDLDFQTTQFQQLEVRHLTELNELALFEFEKYKANQLESDKKFIEETAIQSAVNLLEKWKVENEDVIRKDAIMRSTSVVLGKITEHWLPYHAEFKFNPKDARFIGSPVDLIVFDGCANDSDLINIYFIEVKTGKSRLTPLEKKIKQAVLNKRIDWVEMNPANF